LVIEKPEKRLLKLAGFTRENFWEHSMTTLKKNTSAMTFSDNPVAPVYQCLNAFLGAQKLFYELSLEIRQKTSQYPRWDLRLYGANVENRQDGIYLVIGLEATREDREEVTWTVSMKASAEKIIVEGAITVSDGTDPDYAHATIYKSVFEHTETTSDAQEAAAYILQLAKEVCEKTGYIDMPSSE